MNSLFQRTRSAVSSFGKLILNPGRFYPNLDKRVDKGLLEKGKNDDRTNYYTLAHGGHRELEVRREGENQSIGEAVKAD